MPPKLSSRDDPEQSKRFIDMARDKVKVADQAARPSSRFHMTPTSQKSPLEGKVPRTQRRRPRRDNDG